jgi:hypothetical protein
MKHDGTDNPPCFGKLASPLATECRSCGLRAKCWYEFNRHSEIRLRLFPEPPDAPDVVIDKGEATLYAGVPGVREYWTNIYPALTQMGLERVMWKVTTKGKRDRRGTRKWEVWTLRRHPKEKPQPVLAVERADRREIVLRVFVADPPTVRMFKLEWLPESRQYQLRLDPEELETVEEIAEHLIRTLFLSSDR